MAAAKNIWLDEYKSAVFAESLQLTPDAPSSIGRRCNQLDDLLSDIAVTGPMVDDADDFEAFINAGSNSDFRISSRMVAAPRSEESISAAISFGNRHPLYSSRIVRCRVALLLRSPYTVMG